MRTSRAVGDRRGLAVLLLAMFVSVGPLTLATASPPDASDATLPVDRSPILVDRLPTVVCDEHGLAIGAAVWEGADVLACERPLRDPALPVDASRHEVEGWWFAYGPDRDWNGVDDRLQRIIAGEYDSESTTAIIGADGRPTVAIVIDLAWTPREADLKAVRAVLFAHGWVGEAGGAEFFTVEGIDGIIVDKVPVSALLQLWQLESVVVLEQQNVMYPALNVATRAMLARGSDLYERDARTRGYTGTGVVVAVVDTGVDNEHRSLNDFDDQSDEPDLDANSYADQKWIAGYDATNAFSLTDGSDDPDDGNEHGTHVAGIAIGTGDSRRFNQGVAPGAYLVDVKVLVDLGGTNSQASIRGLNWILQNVNTDWGNNESSRGIDIASMSFGSGSAPNSEDMGDNGSSAEARVANQIVLAGCVVVAASGNDGRQRIPSPASADRAITVGALDDRNTINRSDDQRASFSNWGPRDDDGDDDDWDELKPDVLAPGRGIVSASWAAGSFPIPGQERPMADDGYHSLDGTSMSTPAVSGLIALMLEADAGLRPQEVKDLLRNHSSVRGAASEPSVTDRWNDQNGFGFVDARALLDRILGEEGGNGTGGDDAPPVGDGVGPWVDITSVINGTWFVANETHRVRGTVTPPDGREITQVQVLVHEGEWQVASGTTNWSIGVAVEQWHDPGTLIWVQARAQDQFGVWSSPDLRGINVGPFSVEIDSPASGVGLEGTVDIIGHFSGVDAHHLELRVDGEDWFNVPLGALHEWQGDWSTGRWSYRWDTTTVDDGKHRIGVRLQNHSESLSPELRRTWVIDNLDPAPDLAIRSVRIAEFEVPLERAYVHTYLEVHLEIANEGDLDATDVELTLTEEGSPQTNATVESIESGQVIAGVLVWVPGTAGQRNLSIEIDPRGDAGDMDRSDNLRTITFEVLDRPAGIDLALRPGAVEVLPRIPSPGEGYNLQVRVDNLGRTEALDATLTLEVRTTEGPWMLVAQTSIDRLSGQSSGHASSFFVQAAEAAVTTYRLRVGGVNDLDTSNDEQIFDVLVEDMAVLQAAVSPPLAPEDIPLEWASNGGGGLLLSDREGTLVALSMSERRTFLAATTVADGLAGQVTALSGDDGTVHVVWPHHTRGADGYLRLTVGHAIIDDRGKVLRLHHIMPEIPGNDGVYHGLNLIREGDRLVLAGYHRDLFTDGSYLDRTSLFVATTDDPFDPGSWEVTERLIDDIELPVGQADPVGVAYDGDRLHLLYQTRRRDGGQATRLGLFYAHGPIDTGGWTFDLAVGDHASSPVLALAGEDKDRLAAAWVEGSGVDRELITHVTDLNWADDDVDRLSAPGLTRLKMVRMPKGVVLVHDEVGAQGPYMRLMRLDPAEDSPAPNAGNILDHGRLLDLGLGDKDLHVVARAVDGDYEVRTIAFLVDEEADEIWWDRVSGLIPGEADGVTLSLAAVLVIMVLALVVGLRRRGRDVELAFLDKAEALSDPDEARPAIVVHVPDDDVELVGEGPAEVHAVLEVHAGTDESEALEVHAEAQEEEALEVHAASDGAARRRQRRMERLAQERLEQGLSAGGGVTSTATVIPSAAELAAEMDAAGTPLDPAGNPLPAGLPSPPPPEFLAAAGLPPPPPPDLIDEPLEVHADAASLMGEFSGAREVTCSSCSARFEVRDRALTFVRCPACDTRNDL